MLGIFKITDNMNDEDKNKHYHIHLGTFDFANKSQLPIGLVPPNYIKMKKGIF